MKEQGSAVRIYRIAAVVGESLTKGSGWLP